MASARYNEGKPMLSFILQFPTAVEAHARVKEIGAIKYERDNWRKGGKPDWEYLDAALRHITSFMQGEMFAEDTGCTHLGHAMWNIMALQDLNYPGVTHDPELFAKMCDYWRTVRKAKNNGTAPPTIEEFLACDGEPKELILEGPHSFTDVEPTQKKAQTFQELKIPGMTTFFFEEPLTVQYGQTLNIDTSRCVAEVVNENGEVIDAVALVNGLTPDE